MTAPDGSRLTVLVVGKFRDHRELARDILSDADYGCLLARDTHEALELFRNVRPALVLSDLGRPGTSVHGVELLKQLKRADPDVPVVFLTGGVDDDAAAECLRLGASAVLQRPMSVDVLLSAAARAIERAGN